MNEIIRKRKSVRKYDMSELDGATIEMVHTQIKNLTPLFADIRYSVEIVKKTKGLFGIKAPHYLVFSSEEKEGSYENIGFVGQQMDLFFSGANLGACWLGLSKPEEKKSGALPFVISMAFGRPTEPLHRELSAFKRKPLSEISEGDDDRLEAARLAPSGVNAQNWYFIADGGKIHCYCKKFAPLVGFFMSTMSRIDLGIAICHIAKESSAFSFAKEAGAPERKGYIYVGTVGQ